MWRRSWSRKPRLPTSLSSWSPPTESGPAAGAGGDAGARRLSERLQIPVYDVQKVGYPQRMRDYDARRRIERERALREELEER